MFKDFLFKLATPIACMFSVALAPIGLSADQYYNNSCCSTCEPDPCCKTRCGTNWGVYAGAAAVGAITGVVAGVVAANSNKNHGKRGFDGPTGPTGAAGSTGVTGGTGAGFTVATVPIGQPDAGLPIISLIFTFTVLADLVLTGEGTIETYVTTPDGRTVIGTSLSSFIVGGTGTVTISTSPFYVGQYDVGIIIPSGFTTLAGLVSVEVTNINGIAASPALDEAGIVVGAALLSTTDTFFNAQYPFPNVP